MGADTPRAVLLGMFARERGLDVEAIAALANGARFAPEPLSDDEHARLRAKSLDGAPPHVLGDYPDWLDEKLAATFGDERAEEGAALSSRAPLDLRVNTLKGTREEAAEELAELNAAADALVAVGPAHRGRRRIPKARRSMPSPPSSRARSKSRTRARSSPRCSPPRSRASR